ncbi:MAG TPA: hypothetical protein VGG69_01290 [Rhizomicrobium sp.]
MSKIDTGRMLVGGIVAGIIIDAFEFVLNGIVLNSQWNSIAASHNLTMVGINEIVTFNILGLIVGIAAVWAYAAMRPRFGAGPMTAVWAALLVWAVGYLVPDVSNTVIGLVPMSLTFTILVVGAVELIVATVVGAYLYKESGVAVSPAAAH